MSVKVNNNPLKIVKHNKNIVRKWVHNGVKVYEGSGTLVKGSTSAYGDYLGSISEREVTTSASSWSGSTNSGVFTISGTTTYRLTANCDISNVTVTLGESQWMSTDGWGTLRLAFSKNGTWGTTIVYLYVKNNDRQYCSATSTTFSNLKKGDYITLRIEFSTDPGHRLGLWLGQYTVKYTL